MGSPWRILLIDDDESLRRALARTLRLAGYDVIAYGSADQFMKTGMRCERMCLVLDVNLPGTSGVQLRAALTLAGEDPPTIFVTALERADMHAALSALAPAAILYKPFRNEELVSAVSRACGG